MPATGNIPREDIEIFIGFEDGVYRAEDANGDPANQVECIGGSSGTIVFPTAVSWTFHNRTGHDIKVILNNFETDGGQYPVQGGNVIGGVFESGAIADNGSQVAQSSLNPSVAKKRYSYDLWVYRYGTSSGNYIDPELQIDL